MLLERPQREGAELADRVASKQVRAAIDRVDGLAARRLTWESRRDARVRGEQSTLDLVEEGPLEDRPHRLT